MPLNHPMQRIAAFIAVSFFLLTSPAVFSDEPREPSITLLETVDYAEFELSERRAWFFWAMSDDSLMTSSTVAPDYFVPRDSCLWILARSPGETVLQKFLPLSKTVENFPCSPAGRLHRNVLLVSPNEKYALHRNASDSHELWEVQTGRKILNEEPGEIVLGFDSLSNIYCGRSTSPARFVVRDPETMQIVKSFHAPRDTVGQDLFYAHSPVPVESSDGKYVVISFCRHRSPAEKEHPRACDFGVVHVYDRENGELVYESPFGTGESAGPCDILPLVREDGRKIAFPDHEGKGVWVYDFETRESQSLLIPPPEPSSDDDQNRINDCWKATTLKGFAFTPENRILVWLNMWSDKEVSPFPRIYLFDPEDGSHRIMTDFVSEQEYWPVGESVDIRNRKVTWQFFFSPDGRTVITFQKQPGWVIAPEHIGKYVFWDYRTKEKLFETEAKYRGNIVLTPDWKTAILTTSSFESIKNPEPETQTRGTPDIEFYDITAITERIDVLPDPPNGP